jgi:hypothetical protein
VRDPARGRPRILPALTLWVGLVVCVARGFTSQSALHRLITVYGLWHLPRLALSDQAVYTRLAHGGLDPLARLFVQVRDLLAARLVAGATPPLASFATAVVALDETTLDQVARTLPALRAVPNGDRRLLPGKVAGLFDLRRQQWQQVLFRPDAQANCKGVARALVAGLARGTLVVADLGYFGFAWFDDLTDQGLWWVSRLRAKTSYTVLHVLIQTPDLVEAIVWLGAYRADRGKHAVRLVQIRHGTRWHSYVTNVRDPRLAPPQLLDRVYARRWDIELAFLLVKQHLGLHLLWSAKDIVIQQQVWAVLILSQVLQALRREVADRAQVAVDDVSLPLLIEALPQWAARGVDPLAAAVQYGRAMGLIRPARRVVRTVPWVPWAQYTPLPPDTVLVRTPRYAQRKCGPRLAHSAYPPTHPQ